MPYNYERQKVNKIYELGNLYQRDPISIFVQDLREDPLVKFLLERIRLENGEEQFLEVSMI